MGCVGLRIMHTYCTSTQCASHGPWLSAPQARESRLVWCAIRSFMCPVEHL